MSQAADRAAPPYPPPYPPPRHRHRSVVLPTILIAVGGLFLLQDLGYIAPDFWGTVWRFWPVVLVLIGLDMLLGWRMRGTPLGVVVALATVAVVLGAAVSWSAAEPRPIIQPRTLAEPLQGATRADVTLRFGAGHFAVGSLGQGSDQLAEFSYGGPADLQPEATYQVQGGVAQLEYGLRGREPTFAFPPFTERGSGSPSLDVRLSPDVPMSLTLQTGAADSQIDLSQLTVTSLDVQTGATTTFLRLPQSAGTTTAHVQGGASTVTIEVPQDVAAQIQYAGGLSTLNVDPSRFPSVGGQTYRSPNYDTAQNRVDLRIDVGAATVTVR